MEFLYWLEELRVPVLNEFMLLITHLGEETAFLVVAMILFWCVNKKQGYYILSVGFMGTVANQFLKMLFCVPRPWELDPDFTAIEAAKKEATGFSFPSGHTQVSVGVFGGIALSSKRVWLKLACIVIAVLVPFSRMYLGVHTPQDVLVSVVIALALIFVIKPIAYAKNGKLIPYLLATMVLISVGYLCFVNLYSFPADVDMERLHSGVDSAYTLLGGLLGLITVYIIDEKWIKFPVKAVWWVQILKVAIGLLLALAIKSGLKAPLNFIFGEYIGRAVRYFMLVIFAGSIWPSSFKWLSRIGRKEH